MSGWDNFILYANKLAETRLNSTRLGPLLNAARFNMLIKALTMESKAFLLNLTMIPSWVGWLALRKTGMKFKITLTNGKGKRGQNSIESFAE